MFVKLQYQIQEIISKCCYWYYNKVVPVFLPKNKRLRSAIPRRWKDLSNLTVDINLEIIKNFYEDVYQKNWLGWSGGETQKEFAAWLEGVYLYITKERPGLEKKILELYSTMTNEGENIPRVVCWPEMNIMNLDHESKYARIVRLEKKLHDTDTEVLQEFIEKRNYFWE